MKYDVTRDGGERSGAAPGSAVGTVIAGAAGRNAERIKALDSVINYLETKFQ